MSKKLTTLRRTVTRAENKWLKDLDKSGKASIQLSVDEVIKWCDLCEELDDIELAVLDKKIRARKKSMVG